MKSSAVKFSTLEALNGLILICYRFFSNPESTEVANTEPDSQAQASISLTEVANILTNVWEEQLIACAKAQGDTNTPLENQYSQLLTTLRRRMTDETLPAVQNQCRLPIPSMAVRLNVTYLPWDEGVRSDAKRDTLRGIPCISD